IDVRFGIARISRESPIATSTYTFFGVLGAMVCLWAVRGREPRARRPDGEAPVVTPPSDLEPESVAFLLTQSLEVPGLLGALLDLAKKGYLILHGPEQEGGYVLEEEQIELTAKARSAVEAGEGWAADLLPHQRELLQSMARSRNHVEGMRAARKAVTKSIGERLATAGLLAGSPS